MKKQYIFTFIISILLVLAAFRFQEDLQRFEALGLLGLFFVNFFASATLFIPAPAIASVLVGGAIYPPLLVAFIAALGASLGDMVGFLLGHSGKNIFIRDHHTWYKMLHSSFRKYGGLVIFLFALIPNPLFDAVGIVAGVFSFPAHRFFLLMFLGRLIRDVALAYSGSALGAR